MKTSKSTFNNNQVNKKNETILNVQRREKLKNLLVTKFSKKFNLKDSDSQLIKEEIAKFVEGEKLTEHELKRLEERIKKILGDNQQHNFLKNQLDKNFAINDDSITHSEYNVQLSNNKLDDNKSVVSRISGASHLSRYSQKKTEPIKTEDFEDDPIFGRSKFKSANRLDFKKEGDEWNAIAQYNSQKFEEEKKNNRFKDKELKLKQKLALEEQMKEKQKKLDEEKRRNLEYDNILMQHVEYQGKVEKEKQQSIKEKMIKEKLSRDSQLKDEKKRKFEEFKQERIFDKEIISKCLVELEKEKETAITKKIKGKEHLKTVLEDNEKNKKILAANLQKEREDDIRACEEYTKILDKQEKDRENYFKDREKKQNQIMNRMVETVIKDMDEKQRKEENTIKKYQDEKNKKEEEQELKKKLQIKMNKQEIRTFLNTQINDKKKLMELEKLFDTEQLKLLNKEYELYLTQSKENNMKLKNVNMNYKEFLMKQIEEKRGNTLLKMTDNEYLLNRDLLEEIKKTPNNKI